MGKKAGVLVVTLRDVREAITQGEGGTSRWQEAAEGGRLRFDG